MKLENALSGSLLTKKQVCERLNLSMRCLEGMVKAGAFPPGVRIGKQVYWTEKTLHAWMRRIFGAQELWAP